MSNNTQDHHDMKPQEIYTAKVMLSSKYKRCYESQGEFLYQTMPTIVDRDITIHGSIICEDPINGELNLNFFTSTIDNKAKAKN